MTNKAKEEKRFIANTKESLRSENIDTVLSKLHELKSTGKVSILPYILDLLDHSSSEKIKQEVILFLSNLKDQKCVPVIVSYIRKHAGNKSVARVISTCWQSRLDYSNDLNTFAHSFISGDYSIALESFTVIEEMLWRATDPVITECKKVLLSNKSKINSEKKPLYEELIGVLNEGRTESRDEYSHLYD
ncbi:MAG: hypothetical protein PVF73_07105 [Bacteroidales bacterium]|jgi:hypothetical protein